MIDIDRMKSRYHEGLFSAIQIAGRSSKSLITGFLDTDTNFEEIRQNFIIYNCSDAFCL
jgi:hypothetical protein